MSKGYVSPLEEAKERGDTVCIDLWYPRNQPHKFIQVGLMDVRAADGIRIHYDFERDGWAIEQASFFAWDADDKVCDPGWQEVAFVEAWASQSPDCPSHEFNG